MHIAHKGSVARMSEYFDYQATLARLGNDHELFCLMALCFVEDAGILLGEITAASQANDADRVERAAHSLKGLAATFSAEAVVSRAQFIETCGRRADFNAVRSVIADLSLETERLKAALSPFAAKAGEVGS